MSETTVVSTDELDAARRALQVQGVASWGNPWSAKLEGLLIERELPPFAELDVSQLREIAAIVKARGSW